MVEEERSTERARPARVWIRIAIGSTFAGFVAFVAVRATTDDRAEPSRHRLDRAAERHTGERTPTPPRVQDDPGSDPGGQGTAPGGRSVETVERRVRIEGVVLEPDGMVSAGALVHLLGHETRTATTDASGSFVLECGGRRSYEIGATKGALASPRNFLDIGERASPFMTLRLEPTVRLALEVTDDDSGAPIAGAEITIGGPPRRTMSTDALGLARLTEVAPDVAHLDIAAPGYEPRWVTVEIPKGAGAGGLELRERVALRPGVRVSGRVVDAEGQPIAGAGIHAREDGSPVSSNEWPKSDGAGAWSFKALHRGVYSLQAKRDGYAPSSLEGIVVGSDTIEGLVITLGSGLTLRGRAVDRAGERVARARVFIQSVSWGAPLTYREVTTGAKGEFEVSGLPPARYEAHATKGALASPYEMIDLLRGDGDTLRLVMREARISGRVVTRAGEPVPGARIHATSVAVRGSIVSQPKEGDAREDGTFELEGLPPGRWTLRAGAEGMISESVEAETGATNVQVSLDPLARIHGRVLDREGKAIARFSVDGNNAGFLEHFARLDGSFEVDAYRGGRVAMTVRSAGMRAVHVSVEAVLGGVTDAGTIVLEPGRRLSGRVLTEDGRPVAGAKVAAGTYLPEDIEHEEFLARHTGTLFRTTSAGDGTFTLEGVLDAGFQVTAKHPQMGRARAKSVPAGTDDATVELQLVATGSIRGRLELRGRRSDDHYSLSIQRSPGDPESRLGLCDGERRCFVPHLPAGTYRAIVTGLRGAFAWTEATLAVRGSETTEHTFDLGPVAERVVFEHAGHRPIAGYLFLGRIDATTYGELAVLTRRSLRVSLDPRSTARDIVEGLRPGAYSLCVRTDEARYDENGQWMNPSPTAPLRCTHFELAEGEGERVIEVREP